MGDDKLVKATISVWWDIENCHVPKSVEATSTALNISLALKRANLQGPITIHAFGDTKLLDRTTQEALSSTGVNLNHIPHGNKDAADKAIMVGMLFWALENPPPAHFVLISGDCDFANALHRLRMKGYNIVLVRPNQSVRSSLLASASQVLFWTRVASGEAMNNSDPPKSNDGFLLPNNGDRSKSSDGFHHLPNNSNPPKPNGGFLLPHNINPAKSNGGFHLPNNGSSVKCYEMERCIPTTRPRDITPLINLCKQAARKRGPLIEGNSNTLTKTESSNNASLNWRNGHISSNNDEGGRPPFLDCLLPAEKPELRFCFNIIRKALKTLEFNLLPPTEDNLRDCIFLQEKQLVEGEFNLKQILGKAVEVGELNVMTMQQFESKKEFPVFLPKNSNMWDFVDVENMQGQYPKELWMDLCDLILSMEGQQALITSTNRYQAVQVLRSISPCRLQNISVGHFTNLLQQAIQKKKWLKSQSATTWMPLTINVQALLDFLENGVTITSPQVHRPNKIRVK